MKLAPYPEYKDSGAPWLGKIPAHWESRKLRNMLTPVSDRNRPDLPLLSVVREKGVIKRNVSSKEENHNFIPDDLSNYKVVLKGQFAMNKMKAWQGSYGVSNLDGIVSPAYFVFDLDGAEGKFFHVAIRSKTYVPFFTQASDGVRVGQWDLNQSRMKEIPFFIPSAEEQTQIACFLGWKTAQINKFIRNKRRLIELLKEQKQNVINQAVTRGLNPNVKFKPSGVEWIGDIPEHWEVRRIRACIENYVAGIWGDEPDKNNTNEHIVCIRVADFDMRNLSISQNKLTIRAVPQSAQKTRMLKAGDILMEKSGGGEAEPVGRVVYFDLDYPAVTSNFVTRLRPDSSVVKSRFLLFVLAILQATRRNVPSIKQTTGIQNLDERNYLSNYVGLPALEEQDAIVEHIDAKSAEIDQAIIRAQREIELMREYRTRLISDVVTGQVDVRGIEVPEVAEDELLALDEDSSEADDVIDDEGDMDETD